ncbi:hypothetical protein L1049_018283 [Liquidambar formosana]|uniref:Uncharacterized protein n=1 Tax=Liquidambar formosana TaxID=63359 RepID=A0AAP0WLJ2_LIQFO
MGGGTMLRIVSGAVGAAALDNVTLTKPTTTTTSSLPSLPSSSFSSSSNLNLPVSASNAIPNGPSCTSCFCHGRQTCRCKSVDGSGDKLASGSFHNLIFGQVPSRIEVENAVTSLESFMHGISSSGSELNWFQRMLLSYDPKILQSHGYGRVYDAFRLLQTEPSFQRMVVSISSDKAVWDAVLNNKVVRELRESLYTADQERSLRSIEEPELATRILGWILNIIKAKVVELIENFRLLVNEIFQPPESEKPTAETTDQLDEKLRSSVLLAIVILLIVVVTRALRV